MNIKKKTSSLLIFTLILFLCFMLSVNIGFSITVGTEFSKVAAFSVREDDPNSETGGTCNNNEGTSAKPHQTLPIVRGDCDNCFEDRDDVPGGTGCYVFGVEIDGGMRLKDDCASGILPVNHQWPGGGNGCKKRFDPGNDDWTGVVYGEEKKDTCEANDGNAICILQGWYHALDSTTYADYKKTSQLCTDDGYWYRCDADNVGFGLISNEQQFTCIAATGSDRLCTGYTTFYQWAETETCQELVGANAFCFNLYGDETDYTEYPEGNQGCDDLYGKGTDKRCVMSGGCGDGTCNIGDENNCRQDCCDKGSPVSMKVADDNANAYPGIGSDHEDWKCCLDSDNCVYNNRCYKIGENIDFDGDKIADAVCMG